jgi:hypothetical protein
MELNNEVPQNDSATRRFPKGASQATAKQIVYLLVLQMKSKDGSKYKIAFMSIFASLKDANNRIIQLFDSNFRKELGTVNRGVDGDGALWWIMERVRAAVIRYY